ncbi:hypothetical protein E3T25_04345 [Cryobacterium sandaracinum]|uniref:Uncharacterized protein n=2 Tax=Cryobacterium sandaracinum TaxID=1259247 RepID=A0ABY2JKA4_9MICO|nr:hypothetical protein E3T25_04345 [Cryobacterium sandaracinum]
MTRSNAVRLSAGGIVLVSLVVISDITANAVINGISIIAAYAVFAAFTVFTGINCISAITYNACITNNSSITSNDSGQSSYPELCGVLGAVSTGASASLYAAEASVTAPGGGV